MYGVYFYFYANRAYSAGEPSLAEFVEKENNFQKDYVLFIIDTFHNRLEPELINYLGKNYPAEQIDIFKLFYLQKRSQA